MNNTQGTNVMDLIKYIFGILSVTSSYKSLLCRSREKVQVQL